MDNKHNIFEHFNDMNHYAYLPHLQKLTITLT